jgi:tetratricopeptide (TPR) repeat protein
MISVKQQEEALFDAARNLAHPPARQAFLDQACAGDPGLRARIEELLAAQAEADRFFSDGSPFGSRPMNGSTDERAKAQETNGTSEPGIAEGPGTRIGRYKLLQRIGEGGCGVVYMAEQEEPVRRRVAFKIIKLGMDTKSVIARFEAERQALAMMDHPNIARVLDAGATNTGRPFFVMELVRGVRITEYCDQNQIETDRRLGLLIQVCHAIQHAHQKGIIHRDVKPSNILVTLHDGVPVPKVIDFGIAKATEGRLTDKTLFTAYEQIIGTPAYMSPEQAEMSGLDVDTRSDIYSLGVLLYELLTGRTPFDPKKLLQSGVDEMRRTLREKEPQRPSIMLTTLQGEELTATAVHRHVEPPKLISLVKGDLDWIVMKALEKDRTRRYETANALAVDLERYLANEPVVARPPSPLYRFQKLVHRNKVIFGTGAALAIALVAGLGTSTWLFLREREARRRAVDAERQQAYMRRVAEEARANEAELRHQAEVRERINRALLLGHQGQFEEADHLLDGLSFDKPSVEGASALRSVGEWHALQAQWKQAAERFALLVQVNQLDGWDVSTLDCLEYGPTLIESGDMDGYGRFRHAAITRYVGTGCPVADRILKVCLLLPADPELAGPLRSLAEDTEKSLAGADASGDVFQAAWRSVSLALWEYRQGNHARAVEWCQRCLNYPEYNAPRTATARIILAMSNYRLGGIAEARSELDQNRAIVENHFKSGLDRGTGVRGFWFDWVFARILLREAVPLIEGTSQTSTKASAPERP